MIIRFDQVLSCILLLLLAPLYFILIVLIFVMDGPPIFFKHKRLGYLSIPFTLIKFRTMTSGKSISSHHDESRITSFGKFLR
ncbi:MAG: sugar transferase, partial [Fidelibacterota bacterium]